MVTPSRVETEGDQRGLCHSSPVTCGLMANDPWSWGRAHIGLQDSSTRTCWAGRPQGEATGGGHSGRP